jgi:hypothetical protein
VALQEVHQANDIEEHVSQSKTQENPAIHIVVIVLRVSWVGVNGDWPHLLKGGSEAKLA